MNYLINVRGGPASGKTTCLRGLVENNKQGEEELLLSDGRTVRTYLCGNFVVVGGYTGERKDGLDSFQGEKIETEILDKAIKKYTPLTIVFESGFISAKSSSTFRMIEMAKKQGYQWIIFYFHLKMDLRYERYSDRAGRQLNKDFLCREVAKSERAIKLLKDKGVLCRFVDTTDVPKENMYKLLEVSLRRLQD